ncbi:MAG: DinB family protein [Candidatus Binatia bacterium]
MNARPYSQLVRYKQWADRSLHEVVAPNVDRLDATDALIVLRTLDHIHVVDRIFQHHLQGLPHPFHAPRSDDSPDVQKLIDDGREVCAWYASYVWNLPAQDFDQPVDFAFTNGKPARMTRGEIVLHVCLHGTFHRGNVGILLQKNGISPNDDRMTDFLEAAA